MTTLLTVLLALVALCALALWMRREFERLSREALTSSREQFVNDAGATFGIAQERVQGRLDVAAEQMAAIVGPLRDQVLALSRQQVELGTRVAGLDDRASALTQVLAARPARGQWGEDNLRRVVHLAGLTEGVHVDVQPTWTVDGRSVRPDLVIHLAADEVVIVDAKAPMDAFQRAVTAQHRDDIVRHGKEHASALRAHIRDLGRKPYAAAVPNALDFVVLYLPYEGAIDLAHQYDEDLFDFAIGNKVHLATPHTLIALLNTVALGWQQRQLAESAQKIVALGTRLYERIGVVAGHVATVGKQIEAAGSAYNKVVGSIETNLLTTARELRGLGVSAKDAPELAAIDLTPRPFVKPEVRNGEAA